MQKTLFRILALVLLVTLSALSCKDKKPVDFSDVETEAPPVDSLFIKYDDSLNKYFGDLEKEMLRKYKQNHKDLSTQEEFYNFYRLTHTLKNTLTKTLQHHIKELQEQGTLESEMPDFSWFKELAEGLEVADVNQHKSADIFYDYEILLKYAQNTEGSADDEYTKLIRVSFDDDHYYPAWVQTYEDQDDIGCSLLGEGKHFIVMEQILKARAAGDLFEKEIAKIEDILLRDIIFRKEYCSTPEKAIAELSLILKKLEIKESKKKLFEARIKQMSDYKRYKIQFNCLEGGCKHDESNRPDI